MKMSRASRLWNALALLAAALWLAPSVAWTCPRTGFIGDSPAAVMALAGRLPCAPKPVKRCAMCPEAAAATAETSAPCPVSATMPGEPWIGLAVPADNCCLSAWMPDARRVAPLASCGDFAAVRPAALALALPAPESPRAVAIELAAPRARMRAGPAAPRGPPAG